MINNYNYDNITSLKFNINYYFDFYKHYFYNCDIFNNNKL